MLSLLLEYGETDLATIISNSGPSLPTALYFWNEMLRIMSVRTSFLCSSFRVLYHTTLLRDLCIFLHKV